MAQSHSPGRQAYAMPDDRIGGGRPSTSGSRASALNRSGRSGMHKTQTALEQFSSELNRLQEQQFVFLKKTDDQRRRKEQLDAEIAETKKKLRAIQQQTNNGNIAKDQQSANNKQLGRLEFQLQSAKMKLSIAKNGNAVLKTKVEQSRRAKLLDMQIYNDMLKESKEYRRKIKHCQKEIILINEKKHKAVVGTLNLKNKMVQDMQQFSRELHLAKMTMSQAQQDFMGSVHEKLNSQSMKYTSGNNEENNGSFRDLNGMAAVGGGGGQTPYERQCEIDALLRDSDFNTVDELLVALQQSEEKVFTLYNETQSKNEDMKKIEAHCNHVEGQVHEQMAKLAGLEGHHEQVKQELEKNIQLLKSNIAKYDASYLQNMELITSISPSLVALLNAVAVEDDLMDQQLLASGITDRNIDDFLGLIEQRIDDLIQMSKAAHHQAIKRDDFLKLHAPDRNAMFQTPMLPSLAEGHDDDDDDIGDQKLHPVNINALKDIMQRKIQKVMALNKNKEHGKLMMDHNQSMKGLSSRSSSRVSIRSTSSSDVGGTSHSNSQ